jgi:hypothetical protein
MLFGTSLMVNLQDLHMGKMHSNIGAYGELSNVTKSSLVSCSEH